MRAPNGLGGAPGRTLVAVLDTLVDLNRQVISATLQANQELPAGASFGGLRGGYAKLRSSSVLLRRFAFVPGVELSGSFPVKKGELQAGTIRISGSQAAGGSVRIGSGFTRATGTLGGRHFSLLIAKVRLARARERASGPRARASRRFSGRPDAGASSGRGLLSRLR